MAIQRFKDGDSRAIFHGEKPSQRFPADLIRVAKRKLEMLNAATRIDDLKVSAGQPAARPSGRSRRATRDQRQ